jgi:hypothetical protein
MNQDDLQHIADYMPRADRGRCMCRTKNFTLLCLAEFTDGGWRSRWAYQIIASKRSFSDRWVGHDTLFATKEDAMKCAVSSALAHISTSFGWTAPAMKDVRDEICGFRASFNRIGVDTQKYALWQ